MKLAHIALWRQDLESAAAFWVRYFDAKVGEPYQSKRRPGFVSRFVTLPGDAFKIELMADPWVGPKPLIDNVGWDQIAISLDDASTVDALAARCQSDGMLVSSPRWTGDGFYEAVIEIPDGSKVEITA